MAEILSMEDAATVITAITYTILNIERVNQAVLVAFLQEVNNFVEGEFTGHAVLYSPPAQRACVKTGCQNMLAMIAGVCNPVRYAAGTWGNAPVSFPPEDFDKVLGR